MRGTAAVAQNAACRVKLRTLHIIGWDARVGPAAFSVTNGYRGTKGKNVAFAASSFLPGMITSR